MKEKNLTKILVILAIVIICLISFFGIYVRQSGVMNNILPEYTLSTNLGGLRRIRLTVSDETNTTVYDKDGNITEEGYNEDGSLKEGYTENVQKTNSDEALTKENYDEVKRILDARLKNFAVEDYTIRKNDKTGEFVIDLPENSITDEIISYLVHPGKFTVRDHDTSEVLMDNSYVKNANAVYSTTDSGTIAFLNIEFNQEGKQKLEEISKTYVESKDEEGNDTTKQIVLELDDEELLETYFSSPLTDGILQLSIGSQTTDSQEFTSYIRQAARIAALINDKAMPVEYELQDNMYISSYTYEEVALIALLVIASIIAISVIVYWCIKYKMNGAIAGLISIGYIAVLLIIVRYANVMISKEGIVGIVILLVAQFLFLNEILKKLIEPNAKKEVVKECYKKFAWYYLPIAIIAVVLTFASWISAASIGMILFWGLLILAAYDWILIELLLEVRKNKNA